MSGLAFKYFPAANWRPAGVNIEFDSSQANTAVQNLRALLIGQIFATGTAPPNVPVQGYSQAQVNGLCGANSMLALKYAAYRLQDPFGEVWLGPLLDPVGGGGLPGTITFAGTATAAGSVPLYLMGVPVPVGVNVGDTAVIVAGNVLKTLQGTLLQQGPPPVPITPSAAGAVVTVTPAHAGMAAADIDIRFAYVGPQNGEMMPPGITAVVTGSDPRCRTRA